VDLGGGAPWAAPPFPAGLLRRAGIVRRLTLARDREFALLVAPPGYGKSALLSEWAEHDPREFIWLSPRHRDLHRLVGAGRESGVMRRDADGTGCLPAVTGWLGASAQHSRSRLARMLRAQQRECVVVVDNCHLLEPEMLLALIETATAELPDGSTIALASRTEPDIAIGRMRAHRALIEIRADDLALGRKDARALLRQAGLELDLDAVDTLLERTEGWPAVLYLAALSLRERGDAAVSVPGFSGDDHLVAQYLSDEVLAELSDDATRFLTRMSILDELTGALCDSLLGRGGSGVMLAKLARATQLVAPVDPACERYRLHPIFGDVLRARLRRIDPALEPELHARASAWYLEHGDTDRAVNHASAAHDPELTGDLLWANVATYLNNGHTDLIRRSLERFTRDQISAHATLSLAAAHSSLASGDVGEARRWGLTALAALQRDPSEDGPSSAERSKSLDAGLAVLEALGGSTTAAAMELAATRAYEQAAQNSLWRVTCCLLRGTARYLAGDRVSASCMLEEGIDLGGAAAPLASALCLAQRAMLAIEQDDWDVAAELTDRAEALVVRFDLARDPLVALVFAVSAAARAHAGRVDEAKRVLTSGREQLVALGDFIPWYTAEARILLAHASLWLADIVSARTLLAEASRLARKTPDAVIFGQWFDTAWEYIDTLAEGSLGGPSGLTIAELRILRFMPSHRSFREIATQLGVSVNTVKTQARAVYRKLGAESRSEAVARATSAGLLGH
jgi:LuxR family maltose regulon positive regulatory protein